MLSVAQRTQFTAYLDNTAASARQESNPPLGLATEFPLCRRLASLRMSITRVANSCALNLASFCRPYTRKRRQRQLQSSSPVGCCVALKQRAWLRVDEYSGFTGRKGTTVVSVTRVLWFCVANHTTNNSRTETNGDRERDSEKEPFHPTCIGLSSVHLIVHIHG